MWLRVQFRRVAFPAAAVLSLWLLIGGAVFSSGLPAALGTALAAPVLFIALLVVAALTALRGEVRRTRALPWADVALQSAWWLAIVMCVLPLPGASWIGLAVIVLGLAAFWNALWRLWNEARAGLGATRLWARAAFATRVPRGFPHGAAADGGDARGGVPGSGAVHEVIVVEETHRPPSERPES